MARTTPVSNGWMILVRPLGTIFPVADATMSIVPHQDQASAAQNSKMIVTAIVRPSGDGGVSTISRAAGRNASSARRRPGVRPNRLMRRVGLAGTTALTGFMQASLQPVQRCIAAAGLDQDVVGSVLDQTAAFQGDDAIGRPHCREPVRDDEHGAPLGDGFHVFLNDLLALIVESARRLIEDQNTRVGDECTRDGNTLTLTARETGAALTDDRVVALGKLEDELMRSREAGRLDHTLHRHGR